MNNHLEFLNHSCLMLKTETTKILCDPWFKGTAFGNGWSLLHDNSHEINKLKFDYIWISHEHPDHFSIPTILELTKTCTFLFQETKDKKVKKFLESKGHSVIELKHKEETKIGDLNITCIVCDGYDSSLLVNYPDGKVLLNINDARVELNSHLEYEIEPLLKSDTIDLLTFQFSYANWAGNQGDTNIPRFLQQKTDEKNDEVISKLSPKAILPFASFVYFSHEENFFWNESNWIEHIFKKYSCVRPALIFPIPDQSINLNNVKKIHYTDANIFALDFWKQKHEKLQIKDKIQPKSLDKIKDSYLRFNEKLIEKNTFLQSLKNGEQISLNIKISDLDTTIKVGLKESSFEVVDEVEAISVSSETADFLFTQLFARGTVSINGRVSFNYEQAHRFFLFFFIPYANNIGIYFDSLAQITKDMLMSILRTSVMMAICDNVTGLQEKVENDIDNAMKAFLPNNDPDFDIFNEEPQNENL
jgi:UDP-MurNAc hydroxylase